MKPVLKIAEYRDLIRAVSCSAIRLNTANTGHEQREAAMGLEKWIETLEAANCPKATEVDEAQAMNCLLVAKSLLRRKRAEFDAADVLHQKLAFGAEWK